MPTMDLSLSHMPTNLTARLPGQPWAMDDFVTFVGICRKTAERAARNNQLKLIRIGRRVLVPDSEVQRVAANGLN